MNKEFMTVQTLAPDEIEIVMKALTEYRESKARAERIAAATKAFEDDIQNCIEVFGIAETKRIVRAALRKTESKFESDL